MVKTTVFILGIFFLSCMASSCGTEASEDMARQYCGSCHRFPEPYLLDKATWRNSVLPVMGRLMGVRGIGNDPFEERERSAQVQTEISKEQWQAIVQYYLDDAPEKMPSQARRPVENYTELFKSKMPLQNGELPFTSFLKMDAENRQLYAGSGWDSSLTIFDAELKPIHRNKLDGIIVDLSFELNRKAETLVDGVFTDVGILNPNDFYTGKIYKVKMTGTGELINKKLIVDSLPRPVQTLPYDLDMDGKTDYLVCGFGNMKGSFFWMKQKENGAFEKRVLRDFPGAVKTYVADFNRDGMPDIIALFSQAQEGIFLFLNKGEGNFSMNELLSFPPVYGSSYFEMADINKDGLNDILYTCGDNADYSSVLKNYHGVYVYINKGNNHFEQKFFFPQHGAFKAMARDFDMDGDMDIASISYFPDVKNQPQESFVYLENKGSLKYEPYTIKEFSEGHWIIMDAGDIDQDGDEDIIVGSLFLHQEAQAHKTGLTKKPAFILLDNQTVKTSLTTVK